MLRSPFEIATQSSRSKKNWGNHGLERKDGEIDYSGCSLSELRDVEAHIDAQNNPKNYANLLDALERAKRAERKDIAQPHLLPRHETKSTYVINAADHAVHIWPILIFLVGYPLTLAFVYSKYGPDHLPVAAVVAGALFLFVLLPQVALHWRFLKVNSGMSIRFDTRNQSIHIGSVDGEVVLPVAEINRFRIVKSMAASLSSFQCYPWQHYAYVEISMDDSRRYVVTSLLVPIKVWELILEGYESQPEVFPWPPNQAI